MYRVKNDDAAFHLRVFTVIQTTQYSRPLSIIKLRPINIHEMNEGKILNSKNKLFFKKSEESFQEQYQQESTEKIYECPRCKLIVTVEDYDEKNMGFDCPVCGQKNIFPLPLVQLEISRGKWNNINWLSNLYVTALLVGLFIIFVGAFFLLQPNSLNIKLSVTFLVIGLILPIFLIEKNALSTKVTVGSIILIIILFLVTEAELELFFILLFPSLFLMKIIIDNHIPTSLKVRMNIVILVLFIVFIAFVIKRILNLVSI